MPSIPNTTTYTLNTVIAVVGGASDLVSAFANANAGGFDPVYEGSKNSLLNFRNYQNPALRLDNTACIYHFDGQLSLGVPVCTVRHTGTYTFAWTYGTHFNYNNYGDVFTFTIKAGNTSGTVWYDTFTFTQGGLTASFSVVQYTSPN